MADLVARLKVDSKEYDSKIERARSGLLHLEQSLRGAGKTFADADKDQVAFTRSLGNMQTVARTARGRLSELTKAYTDLRLQYKSLTDAEKQSPFGRALNSSLEQLRGRIETTRRELSDISGELSGLGKKAGGSLFSGLGDKMSGALQVFAGNMLTKAAGAVASLGTEMIDTVRQGVELAKQGEGIRNAFERLGRGDIMQGLREATHGTVTDIELMKAAVKFNDFKLPVEELGTMLAFAQQKAKDTGQSVDYMVDSIVTGLGRKSLMILDNLGLSASEIKARMGETGDMTKAVGAIIREQMAKAGDYVETAADRAAQANVSLQNKMEELGRKFAPVEEASNQLWTSMKIGILDVIGGPLARLLNGLTEAGRLKNMLDDMNGGGNGKESQTEKALRILREYSGGGRGIEGKRDLYNRQMASYNSQEAKAWREANRLRVELKGLRSQQRENGLAGNLQPLINETSRQLEATENRAKAIQIMRANYEAGAKQILSPVKPVIDPIEPKAPKNKGGGGTTKSEATVTDGLKALKEFDAETLHVTESMKSLREQLSNYRKAAENADNPMDYARAQQGIADTQARIKAQPMALRLGIDTESMMEVQSGIDSFAEQLRSQLKPLEIKPAVDTKIFRMTSEEASKAASAIGSIGSALQSIEDPGAKVAGLIATAIANIAVTFASSLKDTPGPWGWIAAAAAGTATMVSTIMAIKSATAGSYAEGGIVKGNTYSGDQIYGGAFVNAGELVLNRAQTSAIAGQLQGNGSGNMSPSWISGEQIYVAMNRYTRRTGRGEIVTWK